MEDDKTGIAKADLLPQAIRDKSFGASWINETITELETTGYLHNHQRMWLAACLIHGYKLYRKKCADWTYYHFLDGELGSNHLSWQWVASTFSHKPYIMNEENIQKYRKKTVTDPLFA
jgi:deoxyribodipyrimidine photo-lyase